IYRKMSHEGSAWTGGDEVGKRLREALGLSLPSERAPHDLPSEGVRQGTGSGQTGTTAGGAKERQIIAPAQVREATVHASEGKGTAGGADRTGSAGSKELSRRFGLDPVEAATRGKGQEDAASQLKRELAQLDNLLGKTGLQHGLQRDLVEALKARGF